MNCEKAQEFFSEYLEGTLQNGLHLAVETHLRTCKDCSEQFASFRSLYSSIGDLPAVDVPTELNETIMRRLDREIWERKQSAKPALGWLRLALAGAALAAVCGIAYFGYDRLSGTGISAGFVPATSSEPIVRVVEGKVTLQFQPAKPCNIRISELGGSPLYQSHLQAGQKFTAPLTAKSELAGVFEVIVDSHRSTYIVVPGVRQPKELSAFEGKLVDGLRLLSDRFGCAFELDAAMSDEILSRDFSGLDRQHAVETLVEGTGLSASYVGGLIKIR